MASDRTTDTGSSFAEKVLGIGRPDGKTKIQGRQCRVSSYFKETLNLYSLVKDRPCSGPRREDGMVGWPSITSASRMEFFRAPKQRRWLSPPPLRL
jgi:hypothetical protein